MAQKQNFDPGLTTKFSGELTRAIERDGSFNVRRTGVPLRSRNAYLFLVSTTWPKFIALVLMAFLTMNLLFAGVFMTIGINRLEGWDSRSGVGPFLTAFFFSVHTLTTVGYGSIYPRGVAANTAAAVEAMVGLLGFALATGLMFARFSRPSAKIVFSDKMLVAPYIDGTSLQFRIANQRDNLLIDVRATVLMMAVESTDGEELRRSFVDLSLERDHVYFFPITWTVVHPIDPASPLYGKTAEDLARKKVEFLILVKGFDETFSQVVNTRFSYRHDEIVWNARFLPAFVVGRKGELVLELNRVNAKQVL